MMADVNHRVVDKVLCQYMTPYTYSFDTYEAIQASNVVLIDSGTCEAIGIISIMVEVDGTRPFPRIRSTPLFYMAMMQAAYNR